jgi:membrane-associated phospholipid phosphatase
LIELPTIDRKRKWVAFAAGYCVFCALYMLTGRVHLRSATPLPLWAVDEFVPFIGWTVWIYHTQFLFLLFGVRALKSTANISRTLYSMGLASLMSFCVFFFYPTTLPRPPVEAEGLTAQAFQFLYSIDADSNCFPSLHVALACLIALGIAEESRQLRIFAVIWAGLICLSTMTTKQHYFADVIAGVCVAIVCRAVANRWLSETSDLPATSYKR